MTAQQAADRLYALLDSLRGCLCAQLDADSTLCACILSPRRQGPSGDCDCGARGKCGTGWVRLDRLYPSSRFPQQDQAGTCGTQLAAVIELGVTRCLPAISAQGAAPTAAQQANAVQQAVRDAYALWAAFSCCEELQKRDYVLGGWIPNDAGDCGGGTWTATVSLARTPS